MSFFGSFGQGLDRVGEQMQTSFQGLRQMGETVDPNDPESVAKFNDAFYTASEQLMFFSNLRSAIHNLCNQITNNLK